ncbi:MAG: histidinol-phosphate transaminase [Bacteroidota bacterium]|jgi:histidinol-phosphate aminotransferase
MSFNLQNITRKNIWDLSPYSSARDEFTGKAKIYLDANENPYDNGLNRYPDPYQFLLKSKIADIKNVKTQQIIIGNGSDEIIDLLYRAFCEPKVDEVISLSPTYGMYKVYANINNVDIKDCWLSSSFEIIEEDLLNMINGKTKMIWFCSPNNPTGNSLNPESIKKVLQNFKGLVIVDEAYIDFSASESWINYLDFYPNLFVMQTLSKAWGLAGLRIGMGFASPQIIALLNKIKPPYNINLLSQQSALAQLEMLEEKNTQVDTILQQRDWLSEELKQLKKVHEVYPSDANFVLVKMDNATDIYNKMVEKSIILRNRSTVKLCLDCIRITIGTPEENKELLLNLTELLN